MKISLVLLLSFLVFLLPVALADLRVRFYSSSCPQAESIIRQVVQKRFANDRGSITAALLRMHFHDCFVRILARKGVLEIDQNLASDQSKRGIVASFASNDAAFKQSFANAKVKMGSIGVLVNNAGEIRTNCRRFNSGS